MSALRSPNCSPPLHCASPHILLIPVKFNIQEHAAPFRVAVNRWNNVSLALHKMFSLCTHLVPQYYIATNRLNLSYPLDFVTIPMEDLSVAAVYLSSRIMAVVASSTASASA